MRVPVRVIRGKNRGMVGKCQGIKNLQPGITRVWVWFENTDYNRKGVSKKIKDLEEITDDQYTLNL